MTDTKHTTLPWKADTFPLANGGPSVKLPRADYELARKAVNSHAALTEALEGLMWRFEDDDSDPHSSENIAPDIVAARAALALAKKGK